MDALIVTFVERLKQKAAEDAEKGTFDAATDTDGKLIIIFNYLNKC